MLRDLLANFLDSRYCHYNQKCHVGRHILQQLGLNPSGCLPHPQKGLEDTASDQLVKLGLIKFGKFFVVPACH